jgi:hypothetical protein
MSPSGSDPEISPPGKAVEDTLNVPPAVSRLNASLELIEKTPFSEPDVVVPNGTVNGKPDRLPAVALPFKLLKLSVIESEVSLKIVAVPNPEPPDPLTGLRGADKNTVPAWVGSALSAIAARNPAIGLHIGLNLNRMKRNKTAPRTYEYRYYLELDSERQLDGAGRFVEWCKGWEAGL